MDLGASMGALRRRWLLTASLLLLTFIAVIGVYAKFPGPYSAESMVALFPSKQASQLNGNNPYLSYGGSENVAGDIVLREVSAPDSVAKLAAKGYTGSFTIADDPNTSGPILDITVTSKSQSVVENTLQAVTNAVQLQLASIQSNLKPANQITSQVVSFAPTPKLLLSKKLRTIVLALGVGLILSYAIPQIVDGNIERRRGNRAGGNFPAAEPVAAGSGPGGGGGYHGRPAYYPAQADDPSPEEVRVPPRRPDYRPRVRTGGDDSQYGPPPQQSGGRDRDREAGSPTRVAEAPSTRQAGPSRSADPTRPSGGGSPRRYESEGTRI